MAFTTSQQTDTILLRGLNFRYNNNAPPSTFFTIFASGNGHTYWSNSVTAENISSLSTALSQTASSLSNNITITATNLSNLSTTVSTNFAANYSTTLALGSNIAGLSNNVNIFNYTFVQFANVTNAKFNAYDSYISTTVGTSVSTAIHEISSGQVFFDILSSIEYEVQQGLSTLSTTIISTANSLYSTITFEYNSSIANELSNITNQLENEINTLSNSVVSSNDYADFSTFIISSLYSTATNVSEQVSSLSTYIVSTYNSILYSSFSSVESLFTSHDTRISSLELLSTNLSSITNNWISTYTDAFVSSNNTTLFSYIQQNSNSINTTTNCLNTLISTYTLFSSYVIGYNTSNDSYISNLNNEVAFLSTAYYLLSVSSILVNIWSSFVQLEVYTNHLVSEIYSSIFVFQSTLYTSSVIMNISTANGYFNYYVSTLYNSTLSTLIPSTIAFTSSMVSTLYSTSYTYLISSLNSTVDATQRNFTSTINGLESKFISTNATQFQSSVLGYLSTPAVTTFSTINGTASDTFNSINTSNIAQSTQFGTFYSTISSQTINLYNSTQIIYVFAVSTLNTLTYNASTQLGCNSVAFYTQLSTQDKQFNSSIISWNNTLISTTSNAYNTVVTSTVYQTSTAAGIVTASTVLAYNYFLSNLNSGIAQVGVSTLYTYSTLLINSTNQIQTMDFTSYRNFQVNIRDLSSDGLYKLTYNSNSLFGQDYRRGIIVLDISTVGQSYSNFNGSLIMNLNTLGIPTTVWGAVLPYIGNADYVAQYEYTILNSILWTNLLGLYPRIAIRNPTLTAPQINVYNIGTGVTVRDPSVYYRGQPISISWSNYSYFPYAPVGGPNFNPYVIIETILGGSTYNTFGPFPFSQSSAQIIAPYPGAGQSIVQNGFINLYTLGYQTNTVQLPLKVILPSFDYAFFKNTTAPLQLSSGGYTFLGGYELVAQTDLGNYPFFSTTNNIIPYIPPTAGGGGGSTGVTYYNMNPAYNNNKFFTNIMNLVGYNGSPNAQVSLSNGSVSTTKSFLEFSRTKGYADFMIQYPSYFPAIQQYLGIGGRIDMTLNSGDISTTIPNISIRQIGSLSTVYEVYNTSSLTTKNIFIGNESTVSVSYSISTLGFVSRGQTPFIGPVGGPFTGPVVQFADTQGFMEIPFPGNAQYPGGSLSSRKEPISTILYYNLVSSVLTSSYTIGDIFESRVLPGDGYIYIYSISTTASPSVQIFNF